MVSASPQPCPFPHFSSSVHSAPKLLVVLLEDGYEASAFSQVTQPPRLPPILHMLCSILPEPSLPPHLHAFVHTLFPLPGMPFPSCSLAASAPSFKTQDLRWTPRGPDHCLLGPSGLWGDEHLGVTHLSLSPGLPLGGHGEASVVGLELLEGKTRSRFPSLSQPPEQVFARGGDRFSPV